MNELETRIKATIAERGRITFAEFMEMALYHPGLGYYSASRERVGADGDFFTSPATHPVFAALIAVQLEQMWQLLGSPPDFCIVETGAGKGLLARDILTYLPHLNPRFAGSVTYFSTERNVVSLCTLNPYSTTIEQEHAALPQTVIGAFLSNELLDAFPVHRVAMRRGEIQEIYVTLEDGEFREVYDKPSTPRLAEQLSRTGITLPEDYCTEVNLNINPWMGQVAGRLRRGFVITIDYGYPARELYAPERDQGTLLTYYRHTCGQNPYLRLGLQDITTHVDFTTAILAGESKGLLTLGLVSQSEFLRNLGFGVFLDALAGHGLSYPEYLANRFAMQELVRSEGMGDFRVLLQSKGVSPPSLYGVTPDNPVEQVLRDQGKRLFIPLLDREHMPLLAGKYPHYQSFDSNLW